ncbi:hypothetical protein ICNMLN_ICNMLN_06110, partial [Dysosmobacter welbionis]
RRKIRQNSTRPRWERAGPCPGHPSIHRRPGDSEGHLPLQLPAEVRVGDGNQRPGPLHGALVFQIRHAELRHHILDAGAGGGH